LTNQLYCVIIITESERGDKPRGTVGQCNKSSKVIRQPEQTRAINPLALTNKKNKKSLKKVLTNQIKYDIIKTQ
jgi:hypothetical protein